ncbi:MAG: hypothetical protein R6W77_13355 [Trueperaceae bacterium]
MISASRRRTRGELSFDEAFRLHQRIARRTTWDRRLLRGALASLAASVIGLVLPLTIAQRAALLAAAFLLGAALPVRRQRERALHSIRDQTGLGYETALEILASGDDASGVREASLGDRDVPTENDPYGLRTAVVRRARSGIRDVRLPELPAWWLPPVAIALGLLLLPAATPLTRADAANGDIVSGDSRAGDEGGAGGDGGDELVPPEEAPGRADEPDGSNAADEEDDAEGAGAAPPSGDAPSQAPLSRFLDSLRERPQDASGEGGSPQPQGGQPQPSVPPPSQQSAPQGAPQNAGEPGAGDEASSEGGEAARASGDRNGADGGGEGDAAAEAGGDDGAGGDSGAQQPGSEEAQGAPSSEEGGGENGGERGEGLTDSAGGDEGGEGLGDAGGAPGAATEAGVLDQGPAASPDLLQGVLEEGPESPAGTVRLPGEDEVELPPGTSYAPYRTAAEDALTEGDIPLSYQEIIRRYFR